MTRLPRIETGEACDATLNENGNTSCQMSALQVDSRIADEPHLRTRLDTGTGERHPDRRTVRLVRLGIGRPDQANEVMRPAEPFRLGPEVAAVLVGDHGHRHSVATEHLEQLGCPGKRAHRIGMDRIEFAVEDLQRLAVTVPEQAPECVPGRGGGTATDLVLAPWCVPHCDQGGIERMGDRAPVVDQGAVPVEQHRAGRVKRRFGVPWRGHAAAPRAWSM